MPESAGKGRALAFLSGDKPIRPPRTRLRLRSGIAEAWFKPARLRERSADHAEQWRKWQLDHKDGQTALIPHRPRLITDDMAVLREATLAGVGVVQLPAIMVWEHIRAGRLVHVLPQWQPRGGIVHAVFPSRRGLLPSVRALLDFLARECAARRQLVSAAAS